MTIDAIRDDFAFLDDWEDRYRYVIELGRELAALPDDLRTDANKVRGCASQVWLATTDGPGPALYFKGDSDAMIVRGLIAILFAIFDGKSADDILATNAQSIFTDLGLQEHLTRQRSNGLASMVARIRADAAQAAKHPAAPGRPARPAG